MPPQQQQQALEHQNTQKQTDELKALLGQTSAPATPVGSAPTSAVASSPGPPLHGPAPIATAE
eukprot:1267839-Alexandrium_andersonii.AAC.1